MWTATSLLRIRRWANHLAFFPVPIYLKKARAQRRTYNTKEALWTTDNSSCTQQQLRVFYTFTLLLIHLVRKFGFPACLCKLVNPHTRLPVGMHTLCRKTRRCIVYTSQPVEVHASSMACMLSEWRIKVSGNFNEVSGNFRCWHACTSMPVAMHTFVLQCTYVRMRLPVHIWVCQ